MGEGLSRALSLFDRYVAMPDRQRGDALDALARTDPDAHAALLALLASDRALNGQAGDAPCLLDSPPQALLAAHAPAWPADVDPRLGTRLGAWRIDAVIGEGGMGTVYAAHRDDGQYRQRVALKCIRAELTAPRLAENFRKERDLLAGLDHPNIATLFDGGVDGAGQPWFAMRLVEGMPIDAWCDARRASLHRRVALLVDACDAVAYAHQHMVLHLDLKPSNLLVTPDGHVQLVDFGLAASLASLEQAPRVAVSQGYTAPEAMAGARPAVAMDVWSLGMVAYRLLCGALPPMPGLLLATFPPGAEPVPAPMSELALHAGDARAQARGIARAGTLARRLAGDLDAIAARCIARDPAQRYASVAALRDDLLQWSSSRPVAARRGGLAYRVSRFVRRHRVVAGLAVAACLGLSATAGIAAWHAQRAAAEARSSAAMSRVFEQTLGVATLSGLGREPFSSSALLEDTERRVRALSLQDHPRVLARGLSMLARNYATVGNYAHATALAREAAALQGDDPASIAATRATLASLLNLQGQHRDALRVAQVALDGNMPFPDPLPRVQLMVEAARSHWHLGDPRAAQRAFEDALALAERTGHRQAQAELLTLRGHWRLRGFHFASADDDLRRAVALALPDAALVADDARLVAAQSLLEQERADDARVLLEHVLGEYRARLGEAHPLTGNAWAALANAQCHASLLRECEASLAHAERIVRDRQGTSHPDYANVLRIRSTLSTFLGEPAARNLALLRRSEAIYAATYPASHENVQRARRLLARRLLLAASGLSAAERTRNRDEAIALFEGIFRDAEPGMPLHPQIPMSLANALAQRAGPGDHARALRLVEANRATTGRFPEGSYLRFLNEYMSARLHVMRGDLDRADRLLEALLSALARHQNTSNNRIIRGSALVLRARIAQDQGDRKRARAWLVRARDHAVAAMGPQDGLARASAAWLVQIDREGRFQPPNE